MRTVSIGDLQSQLVEHLKLATNGEDVVVCDSDKPIARIVPIDENDYSEQTRDLIARGILIPPVRVRPMSEELPPPVGWVSDEVMAQAWREERGEYARSIRMDHISLSEWTAAGNTAAFLLTSWAAARPSDDIRSRASQLVNTSDLRRQMRLSWPRLSME